ncbi:hypothetical protein SAMN05421819_3081 [Bryocella elongata]|uniref:Uncharacterized protein n=1 Tax=Bryocella elongata TaxID=863522 RepID=A0A1H6AEJ0_9BACT|nr:hypothetical protein [Bryocella elongata]SEG46584.1 hypothetical protein SAMN05421819_3081 [Bryocella elongata]
MADLSHYGDTVLIESLSDSSKAKKLTRLALEPGETDKKCSERWLQRLIMTHPGLLPISQVEPVFESMVPICMELPIRDRFVDNVFVTPNGHIAIVECKLWRNAEARRNVIAQVIEYASELSKLSYEEFESAVRRAEPVQDDTPAGASTLFEMVTEGEGVDEAAFHDAVTETLRRGRILIIILGDGIRQGLETMAGFLQQHAGLHFTLCLVELALFELPNSNGAIIAQPRIVGRTTNIERGIVVLDDSRISIKPLPTKPGVVAQPSSISSESFYESLDAAAPGASAGLQALLADLDILGVKPDFKAKTLTLRWTTDRVNWNLGTFHNDGALWMDYHSQQARNLNLIEESRAYLQRLAEITPTATVAQAASGKGWGLHRVGVGPLKIVNFLTDVGRKKWVVAIESFQRDVDKAYPQ